MKIVQDYPPNIEAIKKRFDVPYEACFTYGDTLYNPHGGAIDEALMKHEETHMRQQKKIGVEKWWEFYLGSRDFRLSQEIEAYQNQYREQKKYYKDRNKLNRYLQRLAQDLSSEMYGKIMTLSEARKVIRSDITMKFDLKALLK